MIEQFRLFKRGRSQGKKIYYCEFFDETGTRIRTLSTGQTSKAAARNWSIHQITQGLVHVKKDQKFAQFAENWFIWDKCDYLKREINRRGYRRSYADIQRNLLTNYITPTFGKYKLSQITVQRIEKWLFDIRDNKIIPASKKDDKKYKEKKKASTTKANVTANRCLAVLKIMMKEALRLQLISSDPASLVKKLKEDSKNKGLLTRDEVRTLFNPQRIEEVWGKDKLFYAISVLAATTGMRMGEVQALQFKDVFEDHILVNHSWDRKYGLVSPKANSTRAISLPCYVSEVLQNIIEQQKITDEDAIIFQGKIPGQPVDHRAIVKHLYKALENIDISDSQRRERNITFHSWRHFFNTFMRGKVSDIQLRKVTGHRTEAMTDHYDHQLLEELEEIRQVQNTIL
ncbi:tyrosine-type recombinase/integrase [Spirochaeta isovalerica]|uniref:Integrase n=1 Tax=Spirochaeta isovalerica TaxID=150 RepID=A0A841RF07_9SPIO|nr:site-specific integrase [Spirochaeta isovalerica]MBB6482573.1 integrase [Spirochaeta isovalerica]